MTSAWTTVAAFFTAAVASLSAVTAPPAPTPVATSGFEWPLQPQPQVLRGFEAPPRPWAAGHRGVDLRGSPGQAVLAAGAGTVSFSGVIAGRGVVAIRHANGWRTTYEPVTDRDPAGTVERRGARIGTLEHGTHCGNMSCLHWGLLVGPDDYRDPLSLVESRRVRLLPLG